MSNINIIIQGINGDLRIISISEEASIQKLKKRVKEAFNLPVDDDIRILYITRNLYEVDSHGREQFLKDYQIGDMALVFIFPRIP
ncbi:hypothetical protein DPMN_059926 [Dreissena polymorpha]|uniref:Ubiquitin-like domain-containing protein n=1 Tax=Dreissena polymorpha TaxID=45954 RepID=A0A9D4C4A6_DREPO|nr:hypothetical protein DPMN_059926 [Dreissena polymorpha]